MPSLSTRNMSAKAASMSFSLKHIALKIMQSQKPTILTAYKHAGGEDPSVLKRLAVL